MLNLFPIQFLAPFAYTLLRFCVGSILVVLGVRRLKSRVFVPSTETPLVPKWRFKVLVPLTISILEIVGGGLIVVGAYTQLAVLGALFISLSHILWPSFLGHQNVPPRIFFVLLTFALISLFITGAGAFAFDLPI